jgi:Sugar efflux transporter for intercellular exchange
MISNFDQNFYLFAGNILGLLLSIWFNLSASNLLFKQQVAQLPDVVRVVDSDEPSGSTEDEPMGLHKRSQDPDHAIHMSTIQEGNEEMDKTNPQPSADETKNKDVESSKGENQALITPPPITELPVFYTPPVHDYRVMAMSLLWITVFTVLGFGDAIDGETKELIVGIVTNLCLVFFYGAPLSCIAIVLKTHNTATLHVPTMFTNTASSVFWGIYGLAVLDFFVAVPNLLGALLGFIQIFLYMTYPRLETNIVPVITAAVPVSGGTVGDGTDGTTEMEIVQMQLYPNVGAEDFLGQSAMLGNTNAGEPEHNPTHMAYTTTTPQEVVGGSEDHNIITLHKQELAIENPIDGEQPTENPLVLQINDGATPNAFDPAENTNSSDLQSSISRIGGLFHRRTGSRDATEAESERVDPGAMLTSSTTSPVPQPPTATVASVHHRRVISNTDSSFLAGLFANDNDVLNLETTTTATLHRRVLSTSSTTNQQD